MNSIIKFRDVSFKYSNDDGSSSVLDNFSLEIEKGTFNVILGHNASGKSTVAKLMNGLLKPISGSVLVEDFDTANVETDIEVKRRVGLIFQNPDNQIVSSIVEEDVAFGPENIGLSPKEIRNRVDLALKTVDMYEFKDRPTHKLSGGQKQRVAIAGIIAMEPDCIVLDEPTAMLDPGGRREVMEAIWRLNREKGITIVLITHFMEETENADRVIVMTDGKITADGKPEEVFSMPDKILEAGLSLPQTTELLYRLKQMGANLSADTISVDECVSKIASALNLEAK